MVLNFNIPTIRQYPILLMTSKEILSTIGMTTVLWEETIHRGRGRYHPLQKGVIAMLEDLLTIVNLILGGLAIFDWLENRKLKRSQRGRFSNKRGKPPTPSRRIRAKR